MFDNYFAKINRVYGSDKGTEHSYRPALQEVLCAILPDMDITNDPNAKLAVRQILLSPSAKIKLILAILKPRILARI